MSLTNRGIQWNVGQINKKLEEWCPVNKQMRKVGGKETTDQSKWPVYVKPLRKGKTSFYALAPLVKNALKDKGVSGDKKEYNTGSKICDIFEIGISQ
jgi:hypothetical protein